MRRLLTGAVVGAALAGSALAFARRALQHVRLVGLSDPMAPFRQAPCERVTADERPVVESA